MNIKRFFVRYGGRLQATAVAWLTITLVFTPLLLGQSAVGAKDLEGRLAHQGREWDIGVRIDYDRAPATVDLYISALWRAGVRAEQSRVARDSVSFAIPFDVGTFEGSFEDDVLIGLVHLSDGSESELALRPVERPSVRTEPVHLERGDVTIAATLALPPEPGEYPAVVVLHGGGDSSRESAPYRFWADYLPRRGIAVLIYDKRGNGESTGDWRTVGFDERAGDVISALRWLRDHDEVDQDRLGLLAVSQGAWVASIVADRYPDLAFAVNISGPVVSPFEADTDALVNELRRSGWNGEEIEQRVHLWRLNVEAMRNPTSEEHWNQLQGAVQEAKEEAWFVRSPYEPSREGWFRPWYRLVSDHDPVPALEKANLPTLWMYGERDSESDLSANISILTRLRRELQKPYSIAVFPETGHGLLAPVDERGNDLSPLATPPGFFPTLLGWLEAHLLYQ